MDGPYEYTAEQQDIDPQDRLHSGIGIASFITAAIAWLAVIIMLLVAGNALLEYLEFFQTLNPDSPGLEDEMIAWLESYEKAGLIMGLIFAMMAGGGLCFVAFVLGLIGVFTKDRKKLFPILGTVFGGFPFLIPIFGLLFGSLII